MNQRPIWGAGAEAMRLHTYEKLVPLFFVIVRNEVHSKLLRSGVTLNTLQIVNYL